MKKRNLSKEERRGEEAFKLWEEIQTLEKARRNTLVHIAFLFKEFKLRQLYKDILGDENSSWAMFLAQPEILYSRNRVYDMIRVIERLEKLGVDIENDFIFGDLINQVDFSRLIDIINVATKDDIQEWLHKALTLLPQDFRDEIRRAKKLPISSECAHETDLYSICKHCGLKHKEEKQANEQ